MAGSTGFWGELPWADVGLGRLGRKTACEGGESVIALAVPKSVSSRVLIEDEEEEELLWIDDIVRLLLFLGGFLVGWINGEGCVLGVGEATPRATS